MHPKCSAQEECGQIQPCARPAVGRKGRGGRPAAAQPLHSSLQLSRDSSERGPQEPGPLTSAGTLRSHQGGRGRGKDWAVGPLPPELNRLGLECLHMEPSSGLGTPACPGPWTAETQGNFPFLLPWLASRPTAAPRRVAASETVSGTVGCTLRITVAPDRLSFRRLVTKGEEEDKGQGRVRTALCPRSLG